MKENIIKWIAIFSAFFTVVFWGYDYVTEKAKKEVNIEERIFKDSEEKHTTVIHAKEAEKIVEELREVRRVEKKNASDAIRSRAERDTLLKQAIDISNRNAITVYQMKQVIDTLNTYRKNNEN